MAAGKPDSAKTDLVTADSEKSEYAVASRRTLHVEGKSIGPGQLVNLSASDIAHLSATGFIVKVGADAATSFGVQVGGLQIKGGRKPGGVVA